MSRYGGEVAARAVASGPGASPPRPFTARQLDRLDEVLTTCSRRTGLVFSIYVGALEEPTREHAERLHARLGDRAAEAVLIAVSPGQRVLEITTGCHAATRIPDRSCALAALSMTATFALGNLASGLVDGVRMLADQAGRAG